MHPTDTFYRNCKSVDSLWTDVKAPPNMSGGIVSVWVLLERKESSTLNMDAL